VNRPFFERQRLVGLREDDLRLDLRADLRATFEADLRQRMKRPFFERHCCDLAIWCVYLYLPKKNFIQDFASLLKR